MFLIDHQPIREKFDELHRQLPSSAKPMNTPAKTPAATRLLGLTPVRSRTPAKTVRRRFVASHFNCISGTLFSLAEPSIIKNRLFSVQLSRVPHVVHRKHQPHQSEGNSSANSRAGQNINQHERNHDLHLCYIHHRHKQLLHYLFIHQRARAINRSTFPSCTR